MGEGKRGDEERERGCGGELEQCMEEERAVE